MLYRGNFDYFSNSVHCTDGWWAWYCMGTIHIQHIYSYICIIIYKYCGFLRHLPRIISGECKDGHLAWHWESHSIRIFALFRIIAEFYLTYLGLYLENACTFYKWELGLILGTIQQIHICIISLYIADFYTTYLGLFLENVQMGTGCRTAYICIISLYIANFYCTYLGLFLENAQMGNGSGTGYRTACPPQFSTHHPWEKLNIFVGC